MEITDSSYQDDDFETNKKNFMDAMSNPIIKEMVEWIEHPLEFNKKPDKIEILDERELFWPTQTIEKCYLVKFSVDKKDYIGFTGPITWTFLDIDTQKLSLEDLYIRYTGWYVVFGSINAADYNKNSEGTNKETVFRILEKQGYTDIEILQNTFLVNDNYYELKCLKEGEAVKMIGTETNMAQYKIDAIQPYLQFIGNQWGPFELE